MATYRLRLLTGQHVWTDRSQPIRDPDGNPTGQYERRTVNAGGEITSSRNLAESEPQRYVLISGDMAAAQDRITRLEAELAQARAAQAPKTFTTPGDPTAENLLRSPAVAPGGQVSMGFQATTGGHSGPMAAQDATRAGAAVPGAEEGEEEPQQAQPSAQHAQHAQQENLDEMTVADLREKAARDNVSLGQARTKEDIVRALRAGRKR